MDIGTGTGVLAIHAARRGATKVVATDVDPAALECARENARAAGVADVVETRLVDLKRPGAFSTVGALERFDVVLSNPPGCLSNVVHAVGRREPVSLALSIVAGLAGHLGAGGVAVLLYRSAYLNELVARRARSAGYLVRGEPAYELLRDDWHCLYNFYAWHVARAEGLDPLGLLLPRGREEGAPRKERRPSRGSRGRLGGFLGALWIGATLRPGRAR